MKRLLLHICFALENLHLLAGGYYNILIKGLYVSLPGAAIRFLVINVLFWFAYKNRRFAFITLGVLFGMTAVPGLFFSFYSLGENRGFHFAPALFAVSCAYAILTVLILRARPGTTPDSSTAASTDTGESNRQS